MKFKVELMDTPTVVLKTTELINKLWGWTDEIAELMERKKPDGLRASLFWVCIFLNCLFFCKNIVLTAYDCQIWCFPFTPVVGYSECILSRLLVFFIVKFLTGSLCVLHLMHMNELNFVIKNSEMSLFFLLFGLLLAKFWYF